jgi:hypothetical protein
MPLYRHSLIEGLVDCRMEKHALGRVPWRRRVLGTFLGAEIGVDLIQIACLQGFVAIPALGGYRGEFSIDDNAPSIGASMRMSVRIVGRIALIRSEVMVFGQCRTLPVRTVQPFGTNSAA